jgi:hypothetical protein
MRVPRPRRSLSQMLPKANVSAVELAEKMLLFEPGERITGKNLTFRYTQLILLVFVIAIHPTLCVSHKCY